MNRSRTLLFSLILILLIHAGSHAIDTYVPAKDDVVSPEGLPKIGKWMIAPNNKPADWLGEKYKGRSIKEPVNVILIDTKATNEAEAVEMLIRYCEEAGYKDRSGHSSGYKAYIDGTIYGQLPSEEGHAFSDAHYEFNNDHGRMFGPYRIEKGYLFIGAFSREVVGIYGSGFTHKYGSFKRARDGFARSISRKTDLKKVSYVEMGNKIDSSDTTTGDHDGKAVLIRN